MACIRTTRATSTSEIRSMSKRVVTKKCLIALMINFLIAISSKLPSTLLLHLPKRAHMGELVVHLSSSDSVNKKRQPIRRQVVHLHMRLQLRRIHLHLHLPLHIHHLLRMVTRKVHHLVMLIQHHLPKSQICLQMSSRMLKTLKRMPMKALANLMILKKRKKIKQRRISQLRDFTQKKTSMDMERSLLTEVLTLAKSHTLLLDPQQHPLKLQKTEQQKKKKFQIC